MKAPMTIYNKLVGFTSPPQFVLDLQDSLSIVTGDANGEITIWDYHKTKIKSQKASIVNNPVKKSKIIDNKLTSLLNIYVFLFNQPSSTVIIIGT